METIQSIKLRFGIVGNDPRLNRSLEKAIQIAPTDISVLVIGESGVGKEFIPKIVHQLSARKHSTYIAVNCGAIPEGTIDSELFGHEKGSFTGADKARKGYFEEANGGTIFLDEVAELPLQTQVRLLRVLESGEFMKVGSSKILKTDVRVVAATNVNVLEAVRNHKFREDLYYRLNTMQIDLPALRNRKEDIPLLFRKFVHDFSEKYRTPPVELSPGALRYISNHSWPGNVRQLRNFAEQISVVEKKRLIDLDLVKEYLPAIQSSPALFGKEVGEEGGFSNEREILFKFLFDMKKDLNDLRALTLELLNKGEAGLNPEGQVLAKRILSSYTNTLSPSLPFIENENEETRTTTISLEEEVHDYEEIPTDESYSLQHNELELIKRALEKHSGKRKYAAQELGISERTLYRKIKQYDLN